MKAKLGKSIYQATEETKNGVKGYRLIRESENFWVRWDKVKTY
jgi:hypothetical protein